MNNILKLVQTYGSISLPLEGRMVNYFLDENGELSHD